MENKEYEKFTDEIRLSVNEAFSDSEAFEKLYIGKKSKCIPDELIGEDLLLDIKNKFYWFLSSVRDRIEEELNASPIFIYVDPSYEDRTYAIIAHKNEYILYLYSAKPWNMWWDSEQDMEDELQEIYSAAKAKLYNFLNR